MHTHRPLSTRRRVGAYAAALTLAVFGPGLVACGTDVGDDCSSDAECGVGRICDRNSRGGYCTVSPCNPGTCPDDSVCIEFENRATYCMAWCDESADCRPGYYCATYGGGNASAQYCRQCPTLGGEQVSARCH